MNKRAILFVVIHLSVGGYFGLFLPLPIMKNVAKKIHVQIFLWTYVSISLGYMPESRTSQSYGKSIFNILRNCQGCSNLRSQCLVSQCLRASISLHPYHHLLLSVFFIFSERVVILILRRTKH